MTHLSLALMIILLFPAGAGSANTGPKGTLRGVLKIGYLVWNKSPYGEHRWVQPTDDLSHASQMLCFESLICFGYNPYTQKVESEMIQTRADGHRIKRGLYSSLAAILSKTRFTEVKDALYQQLIQIKKDTIQSEFLTEVEPQLPVDERQVPVDKQCVYVMLRRAERYSIFESGYDPGATLEQNMKIRKITQRSRLRFGHYNFEKEGFERMKDDRTREPRNGREPNCVCPALLGYCYCLMSSETTTAVHEILPKLLLTQPHDIYHPTLTCALDGKGVAARFEDQEFRDEIRNDLMDALEEHTGLRVDNLPQTYIRAVLTRWNSKYYLSNFNSADLDRPLTSLLAPATKRTVDAEGLEGSRRKKVRTSKLVCLYAQKGHSNLVAECISALGLLDCPPTRQAKPRQTHLNFLLSQNIRATFLISFPSVKLVGRSLSIVTTSLNVQISDEDRLSQLGRVETPPNE
ncbi:hypothetical protein F5880DRAFT_1510639 [Lentinula raphanica]|nr:hypothetical protein F5880DRAFT_1510639 [Lentinula raphanica]